MINSSSYDLDVDPDFDETEAELENRWPTLSRPEDLFDPEGPRWPD